MQFDQLKRRDFVTMLGGAAAWPLAARAQQPAKVPLVGVLVSASPPHPFADAFWRGLRALGYSEGQNIKVEFRYTEGRSDRAEEFAEEFVRVGVNVIVAHYAIGTAAAMAATRLGSVPFESECATGKPSLEASNTPRSSGIELRSVSN